MCTPPCTTRASPLTAPMPRCASCHQRRAGRFAPTSWRAGPCCCLWIRPHTRLRRLVAKAFTPNAVAALRPRIQAIVDTRLDEMNTQDEVDVIRDLAFPVPLMVIAEMLGVPIEDHLRIKAWSSNFT